MANNYRLEPVYSDAGDKLSELNTVILKSIIEVTLIPPWNGGNGNYYAK